MSDGFAALCSTTGVNSGCRAYRQINKHLHKPSTPAIDRLPADIRREILERLCA